MLRLACTVTCACTPGTIFLSAPDRITLGLVLIFCFSSFSVFLFSPTHLALIVSRLVFSSFFFLSFFLIYMYLYFVHMLIPLLALSSLCSSSLFFFLFLHFFFHHFILQLK